MASSARACRACRRRLVDTISSFTGYSSAATRCFISRSVFEHQVHQSQTRRPLHSTFLRTFPEQQHVDANSTASHRQDAPSSVFEQPTTSKLPPPTGNSPTSSDPSIPWYLRIEPPTPPAPTFSHLAAQELPPLPTNPPDILLPILQHLSISIGLDSLTLLDLRDLSPPSALGANLIMIIGTARSHKHLNTSADRFCRWLRSTYKLRPYADGLLGRNELKLKLRRRNRRMKLAQSVGNTTALSGEDGTGGYDSGITTGWICCNLGAVGEATVSSSMNDTGVTRTLKEGEQMQAEVTHVVLSEKDQERILEDEEDEYVNSSEEHFKYRGFGSISNAPRIVVQMFVEEKRLEMDLEGLWESRILRRERKELKRDEDFADQLFETRRIEEELVGKEATLRE